MAQVPGSFVEWSVIEKESLGKDAHCHISQAHRAVSTDLLR